MAYLIYCVRSILRVFGNILKAIGKAPDFVTFTLDGPLLETSPPRPSFPRRMLSPKKRTLRDLERELRHVAGDRRVKGIVLRFYGIDAPPAQLQSLRDLIAEVRQAGKRVVTWSHNYSLGSYYVACAADEILLQHAGTVTAFGLESRYYYLADALAKIGLKGDLIQITPYKTAADLFMRTDMSNEAREMATWMIDDIYRQYLEGIAEGRSISMEAAEAVVDSSPHQGQAALTSGAVDAIVGEEELPKHLGNGAKPANLLPYAISKRKLRSAPLKRPGKCIAVLRIAGDIIDGKSATPPFKPPFRIPLLFSERAGDLTVVHHARLLARSKRVAAVVVHVDSGGGSATSSEAMAAALQTVADKKPLIVSMGSVAASGGYYVATPGAKILAQPGTLTGSIGVLSGKLVNAGLYEKLLFHREILRRGAHAGYYAGDKPFSDEERQSIWESINIIYQQFTGRVAESREMTLEAVDAIGGGRVWTGAQALAHGLVDELGGLDVAISRARESAGLGDNCRVVEVKPSKKLLAPASPSAAGILEYTTQGMRMFAPGRALMLSPFVLSDDR